MRNRRVTKAAVYDTVHRSIVNVMIGLTLAGTGYLSYRVYRYFSGMSHLRLPYSIFLCTWHAISKSSPILWLKVLLTTQ